MISLLNKSQCCGCSACVSVCPQRCIHFVADREGFLYPKGVDTGKCIDCDLCEKVCPVLSQREERKPIAVYAAKNSNEPIRMCSSSGGAFTLLAERIIANDGVVFGARFDDAWNVIHAWTDTVEGLSAFRGSKYVQSKMGQSYQQVKDFLSEGRQVLFSGTPCQVSGLKRFLRKEYDNLLTVDFVCHGVPSPKVWQIYLQETIARQGVVGKNTVSSFSKVTPVITGVNFREKSVGWKKYSFALTLSKASADGEKNSVSLSQIFPENPFMKAFLADLILRPSCYDCPAKAGKSGADITIGDFWGIEHFRPDFDDDKGCSLIMCHNEKTMQLLGSSMEMNPMAYEEALAHNPSIEVSVSRPFYRDFFMRNVLGTSSIDKAHRSLHDKDFASRLKRLLYRKFFC